MFLSQLTVRAQLRVLSFTSLLILAVAVIMAAVNMNSVGSEFKKVVEKDQAELIAYSDMYAQGLQMGQALRNVILDPKNKKGYENYESANTAFAQALAQIHDQEAVLRLRTPQQQAQQKILQLVGQGELEKARDTLVAEETPRWRELRTLLVDQVNAAKAASQGAQQRMEQDIQRAQMIGIALGAVGLVLVLWLSRQISLAVLGILGGEPVEAAKVVYAVAHGHLDTAIHVSPDSQGSLLASIQFMQTHLKQTVSEIERVVAASAAGNFAHRVDLAGKEGFAFVIGQSLNQLNQHLQQQIGGNPAEAARAAQRIAAGDLSADIVVHPQDQSSMFAAMHQMQLALRKVIFEVRNVVDAAAHGDFSQRLTLGDKEGFARDLAIGLNYMQDSVETSLTDVAEIMDALAYGDLTRKMEGEMHGTFASLKASINTTIERLRDVVADIQGATQHINQAANEIATGNHDLSQRTEMQASNVEETSSAMEEINAMVRQNASSARQANDLAADSNQIAARGSAKVKSIVHTMGAIQESSKRIEEIIGVIDGIAFQTNILALNAAVEAARAGEQGRGFAVVASEVRTLAQRSAQAAKEIKTLISNSVQNVYDGVGLVEDAGSTMDEVESSFGSVAHLLEEISRASQEQASGVSQVAQALVQMDSATQQNAALVEEATAASRSLKDQADQLAHATQKFKVSANGGLNGLDFSAAISAHRQWKSRLSKYVQGISQETLDAAVVECDDKCALGKWIYSDGQSIANDSLYSHLKDNHAKFHRCAGKVIRLHQAGDERQAMDVLTHEFTDQSASTIGALRQLREKYNG